jgi:hypothetical protein
MGKVASKVKSRSKAAQRSGNTTKATKLLSRATAAPTGHGKAAVKGKAPAKATAKPQRQPKALPVPLQHVTTMTQEQVEAAVAKLPSKAARKRAAKAAAVQAKIDNAQQQAKERLLVVGDRVVEYQPAAGQVHVREGDVIKVWYGGAPPTARQHARVRIDNGTANKDVEDVLLEGPATLFRRTATVSNGGQLKPEPAPDDDIRAYRPKEKVDIGTYQVYQDQNGVAYLRVGYGKHGALLVVNKGLQVELIDMPNDTIRALYLQPVVGSSILDAAKKLLHPMNDHATISVRAKAHLITILENEELQNMATKAVPATKPAKFASVTAPPAKNAPAKKAVAAKKAAPKGGGSNVAEASKARSAEVFATKVVATKAATEAKETSFAGMLGKLAAKPIVLSTLVDKVTAELAKGMRSAQDPAVVARARTRDAFTRLGLLRAAK